ncbi:CG13663 [Drosophila busckii]|uniref:CG13663 n=2 Tax=Drosophila busckii TaxID=30019 RepID=A0A0M3QY07_DROBS|nr:CG13663 [Drosophila busckii]
MLGTGAYNNNKEKCDDTKINIQNAKSVNSDTTSISSSNNENSGFSDDEELTSEAGNTIGTTADERKESKVLKYTLWAVYLLFWITLYVIAIELKFGLVFLMFSALFGIYFNTRTGTKKKNEISAYSVFNKNFESIDGTLKAEQFDREMRYGAGSVH